VPFVPAHNHTQSNEMKLTIIKQIYESLPLMMDARFFAKIIKMSNSERLKN
jgi:hypothetical protein